MTDYGPAFLSWLCSCQSSSVTQRPSFFRKPDRASYSITYLTSLLRSLLTILSYVVFCRFLGCTSGDGSLLAILTVCTALRQHYIVLLVCMYLCMWCSKLHLSVVLNFFTLAPMSCKGMWVTFSCSPTSTDRISRTKPVLQQPIDNERYAKTWLKIQTTSLQLCYHKRMFLIGYIGPPICVPYWA